MPYGQDTGWDRERKIITYDEYKLYCYTNGFAPLRLKDTGMFIRTNNLRFKKHKEKEIKEIFTELSDEIEDGNGKVERILSLKSLNQVMSKLNIELKNLKNIFKIAGTDKIDYKTFCKIFNN